MKAYLKRPQKTKFTRHIGRAAQLAGRASRELDLSSELVRSRTEIARLLRMADHLRAFTLNMERVAPHNGRRPMSKPVPDMEQASWDDYHRRQGRLRVRSVRNTPVHSRRKARRFEEALA